MAEVERSALEQSSPKLNEEQLRKFGRAMFAKFGEYKANRRHVEQTWLASLRQFKGIYDPGAKVSKDRSQAYPKLTRHKLVAMVARLMEMLFSATGRNWDAEVSKIPDLPREAATDALNKMYAEFAARGVEPALADAEKALLDEAKRRAARMRDVMDDQLQDMDYVGIARKVVFSAVMYGAGVMKGPLTRKVSETVIRRGTDGKFGAVAVERQRPYFDFLPIWAYYPDMTARSHTPDAMDGHFERHALTRAGVLAYKGQPGFIDSEIDAYLRENQSGDYKPAEWEQQLRAISKSEAEGSDRVGVNFANSTKYELAVWWGECSAKDLRAAGVDTPDDVGVYESNVYLLGNRIVKAIVSPLDSERFKRKIRPAHVFIFEEDDISVFGSGLPPIMRDSQLNVANAARMLEDNASVVTGPNVVVDKYALVEGQDLDIYAWKTWVVDHSRLSNGRQPVYSVNFDSHIGELERIIQLFREFADTEVSLPAPLQGLIQGGSEAYRTSTNTQALLSAAAMPIRDTVRNFDQFTESAMLSLFLWNMKFGDDPLAKTDLSIVTRGATTLIAKEARANGLDYLAQTMNEDERLEVNVRKFLERRMEARDIDMDVLDEAEVVARRREERAAAAAHAAGVQEKLVEAQVRELLSKALKNAGVAAKTSTDANARALEVLMGALSSAADKFDDNETPKNADNPQSAA